MRQVTSKTVVAPSSAWAATSDPRPRFDRGDAADRVRLAPGQAERVRVLAGEELQRQDPHPDEVRPVDALEALGDHGSDPEEQRALRRPVPRRAGAVLAPGDHDARHALRSVSARDVIDEALLAVRQVDGVRTLALAGERIPQPDVAEGPADEHLVVAPPRPVRVELQRLHAVLLEPRPGGRPGDDRAGRRDVVRGHRVAEAARARGRRRCPPAASGSIVRPSK